MKLFKLLFLYFLSFTGFLCYGNSFSNGVIVTQWGATNQNPYLKSQSMYYVVPAQKWNKLPDEIKIDVFKTEPEQMRAFFNSHGLDERDMVGHYIGSMGHVEADVMFEKVRMFDEIYTGMGMENHVFREWYNSGAVGEAFIAGSNMEEAEQIQWVGQQNWDTNIRVMGIKEPKKIQMNGTSPFDTGVVNGVSVADIMARAIGLKDIGVDAYVANTAVETMQEMAGKMVFMKNNTDYVMAKMAEKGLGNNMIMPHQNLQFYLTEPIGGGGGAGAAILASMGIDTPEDYFELVRKIRATGMSYWHEALEKGQIETSNIPAFWFATPSTNQVFDNPAFYEIWNKYFQ